MPPFININFTRAFLKRRPRETMAGLTVEVPGKTEASDMKRSIGVSDRRDHRCRLSGGPITGSRMAGGGVGVPVLRAGCLPAR